MTGRGDSGTRVMAARIAALLARTGLGAYSVNPQLPKSSETSEVLQGDKPAAGKSGKVDRFGDALPAGAVMRLGTLGFRQSNLVAIGFRKTGALVGFGQDLAVHVWPSDGRAEPATTLLIGKKEYGWRRAMSADGRFTAGFVTGPKLVVWDIGGAKPAEYLSRKAKDVYQLAFSPNGEWLAVNDADRATTDNLLLCHLPRIARTCPGTDSGRRDGERRRATPRPGDTQTRP